MCNAHNHPASCTCGWGGEGHRGRRAAGVGESHTFASPLGCCFTNCNSFTDPNATCPVCGEQVFFYQSANGGRVFFDSLGPPWPKHACTDNGIRPLRASFSQLPMPVRNTTLGPWEWFLVSEARLSGTSCELVGVSASSTRNTYKSDDEAVRILMQRIRPSYVIALIRRLNETRWDMSFLDENGNPRIATLESIEDGDWVDPPEASAELPKWVAKINQRLRTRKRRKLPGA